MHLPVRRVADNDEDIEKIEEWFSFGESMPDENNGTVNACDLGQIIKILYIKACVRGCPYCQWPRQAKKCYIMEVYRFFGFFKNRKMVYQRQAVKGEIVTLTLKKPFLEVPHKNV